MTRLELTIQCLILCVAACSIGLVTRWWIVGASVPGDYLIYWQAAQGQYVKGWLYKNWTAIIFKPFLLTDPYRAFWYWCGFQTFCFMVLAHKMMQVKYGWVLVLFVLPQFKSLLLVGNIQIVLSLAVIYPIPALLAGLVKPPLLVFALILAIAGRYRFWDESRKRVRTS